MVQETNTSRRDAIVGLGALAIGSAFASSSHAGAATRQSDLFEHPLLQASPQWTLLEDGRLALWMLARSGAHALRLTAADTASGDLLAAAGLAREGLEPSEAGLILLPSPQERHPELVELARSRGALDAHGLPVVHFFVESAAIPDARGPLATLSLPRAAVGSVAEVEGFSFLFGSCINPGIAERVAVLNAMALVPADFCFLLGDSTYFRPQDWNTRDGMLARWAENRALKAFAALGASKPILAIWDDHDYGPNDSTGNFPNKALSRAAFLSHFPRDVQGPAREGTGIHFTLKIGGTRLVFLDDRTWRDPTPWITRTGGAYLGDEQFRWFQDVVEMRDYSRLVVAGGSQFFAPNPFKESYRRHCHEFSEFTALLRDTLEVPVTFLSGDVHLTEVTALDGVFPHGGHELTNSGIGNNPVGVLRAFKRLNRSAYLYDRGLTFARVTVLEDAVWFDHFNAQAKLLARLRFPTFAHSKTR
jgi:hypothetical protein